MQVSATLIAAQQAAREARARLQAPAAPGFAAALGETQGAAPTSPLALKNLAAAEPSASAQPQAQPQTVRLGTLLDITV